MKQMTQTEMESLYIRHSGDLRRLCFSFLKNSADAEDAMHETFVRLYKLDISFASPEHERGWMISTASNICKNILRRKDRIYERVEDHEEAFAVRTEYDEVADAILALPDKYKDVMYLYYYEGFKTEEIAKLLGIPHSTVRSRLSRGRKQMKKLLG